MRANSTCERMINTSQLVAIFWSKIGAAIIDESTLIVGGVPVTTEIL
jgi:hypothetical protein